MRRLGGLVGVDDQGAIAWLEAKLTMQTPVTRALRDSRFPSLLALQLAKISNIPKPMYLLRAMPLRITLAPITAFDQRNHDALLPRLLCSSIPSLLRHLSLSLSRLVMVNAASTSWGALPCGALGIGRSCYPRHAKIW